MFTSNDVINTALKDTSICKKLSCISAQSLRIFISMQECLAPNQVESTISGIQSKVSRCTKKEETLTYNEGKSQSIETDLKLTYMFD